MGCRNRHGSKCRHCGLNCLDPENPTAAAAHQAGCKEAKRSSSEVKLSSKENDECPICLTSIKDSKKMYGIMGTLATGGLIVLLPLFF